MWDASKRSFTLPSCTTHRHFFSPLILSAVALPSLVRVKRICCWQCLSCFRFSVPLMLVFSLLMASHNCRIFLPFSKTWWWLLERPIIAKKGKNKLKSIGCVTSGKFAVVFVCCRINVVCQWRYARSFTTTRTVSDWPHLLQMLPNMMDAFTPERTVWTVLLAQLCKRGVSTFPQGFSKLWPSSREMASCI